MVAVLERLGHQVDFPAAQACCGQMHFNTGYRREAVPMARGFTAAFAGYEAVVTPSASCASMVKEYFPALAAEARDPGLARAVAEVAPRTYELSVFLADVLGVTDAGGHVHWAADADEANAIVAGLVRAAGADSVVKVKSMATQETGLNEALAADGTGALETDLAELIVQLGHDRPSHILVPAIHKKPGGDQGDLPYPDAGRPARADRRPGGARRRRAIPPAAGVPVRVGGRVRRELRDRRDRIAQDFHLVIVRASQVYADLADAFARLVPDRPHTLISGPSATSDIELIRVEGVHGPRHLHVLLAERH